MGNTSFIVTVSVFKVFVNGLENAKLVVLKTAGSDAVNPSDWVD